MPLLPPPSEQTKELATRYERSLQDSELLTEKSKTRFDVSIEELERILLQKEGESPRDNIQGRSPGGKRAIGKAAAKGALLLKGKNPGNVSLSSSAALSCLVFGFFGRCCVEWGWWCACERQWADFVLFCFVLLFCFYITVAETGRRVQAAGVGRVGRV